MSFKEYLKERDERLALEQEEDKKQKIADFIRKIDDLNDARFHEFAVDELGMTEDEAEAIVFKLLKSFLLDDDKNGDAIPDGLDFDDEDEEIIDDDEIIDNGGSLDDLMGEE